MGEKQILTEEMIEERMKKIIKPQELYYVDPYKLAHWKLETACAMVDDAISVKTIQRAIDDGKLEGYKAGKFVTVEPAKFLLWYRRFRQE